ncbi:MAG: hypothetical protein U9Q72_02870 [Patescibacteria group bacterium]|nr:hypothetical protein [Patescibacteria group bacterium]
MELLEKTIKHIEKKKRDNSNKKELLANNRHPKSAHYYKKEWSFIEFVPARENITYQLQYLEYMTNLYNDYQMYLTIESLHCKNMMITIASIMECALYDLLYQLARKRSDIGFDEREDFLAMIDLGFRGGLLNEQMKNLLHELRKVRNFVHISNLEHKEYEAYDIEQVNNYIILLDNFKDRVREKIK